MPSEIDRDDLHAKLHDPNLRLLDAQGPGWFEREHLPGAIRGRLDDPDATVAALGDDLDAEIVVYCSNASCTGSALAANLLEGRGYSNVKRYTAGKQDWLDAGLPVESETRPVRRSSRSPRPGLSPTGMATGCPTLIGRGERGSADVGVIESSQ